MGKESEGEGGRWKVVMKLFWRRGESCDGWWRQRHGEQGITIGIGNWARRIKTSRPRQEQGNDDDVQREKKVGKRTAAAISIRRLAD